VIDSDSMSSCSIRLGVDSNKLLPSFENSYAFS